MSTYLLAIDQGTTSSRAILFDKKGNIKGMAQEEVPNHYPESGWVEQDPQDIWNSVWRVCLEVMNKTGVTASEIAAAGVTNQRETTIVWDRNTGEPIYPAIVWQDRRTADFCEDLQKKGKDAEITKRTGLLADPYFSATKIRWILNHVPGARKRAEQGELAFGTVDCWLIWKLNGGNRHQSDATNASRTILYNIITGEWDPWLLDLFDVPSGMLPEVCDCAADFGSITFPDGSVPILGVAGDQQAAAIGQACVKPGMVKSTYGTGCFVLLNTGDKAIASSHRLLTTVAYRLNGRMSYALEGSIFIAGAAVQWLRDGLKIIQHAGDSEAMARAVPDNHGVYVVPAFTGLGAPWWEPNARGAVFGLTQDSSADHLVRATLESVSYQTRDLIEAMAEDGLPISTLRVDGGMVANEWLMQNLADTLAAPVERPVIAETTSLGAAFLAGLKVGWFESLEDVAQYWQRDGSWQPLMDEAIRDQLYKGWRRAVGLVASR